MFQNSHERLAAITARNLEASVSEWREARDGGKWFDGELQTVDYRLGRVKAMLHHALSASARFSVAPSSLVEIVSELTEDRRSLEGLKNDLLTGAASRRNENVFVGRRSTKLNPEEKRYVELESHNFLSHNEDCVGNIEELSHRAQRHADLQTSDLSPDRAKEVVAAFVHKVMELGRATVRRQASKAESAPVVDLDFPDSMLFG